MSNSNTAPGASRSSEASFHLADGIGYGLQQDHQSVIRLNLQHYLWREVFGFNIHPDIPPGPEKIVDVACGSGLWMIDVARELPRAQIDGLDIDLTQAPQPGWLPSNINLSHWDLFNDIPTGTEAKYNLVHVRLLVLVLSGLDPMPVIRRLFHLVKPGGYIQWDELDCVNMRVKRLDSAADAPAPALEEIREASHAGGRHDWALDLPRLLTEGGFHDAKSDYYDDPPELVRAFNDLHLLTMQEFASKLASRGQHEAAARFVHLIQTGYQEGVKGTALCIPRVVVVAKRPVEHA
ncbi:hypothetical protein N7478_008367 [Penicillium angulare]|uniref:uncharacterized protein n=1 Tax=Penicillium angulare TaxID=116970 RepID=UPI0025401C4A|nr:uncharacterized protein N7478_008367 [Penicillium angulare]KAJ5273242.1 hypothetical protein N7478_008367 [Penicillium angulare]